MRPFLHPIPPSDSLVFASSKHLILNDETLEIWVSKVEWEGLTEERVHEPAAGRTGHYSQVDILGL